MTAFAMGGGSRPSAVILSRQPERSDGPAKDLRFVKVILRVPLLGKLLGANLGFVAAAFAAHAVFPSASVAAQLGVTLAMSFCATAVLVWLALRPIVQLEHIAERVSDGDFNARVPASPLADRNISKLSSTMNRLLDRVDSDRARIHYLAGRAVRARDIERESVARELREELAQSLSAVTMQIAAARASNDDPAHSRVLEDIRETVQQVTDEMRSVAEALYPGTLEEFGLTNAIEALARRVTRRSSLGIKVEPGLFDAKLSPRAASALYRVADEALRNVEQHAQASHARIVLSSNSHVTLEIEDDGRGIDMKLNDPLQAGLGLFSARTVLALVGGELQISSAPGRGTHVIARVPTGGTP
jgi:two-component system, NarL family, sensor histidine kinase UhpB